MKHGGKIMVCLVGGLAFSASANEVPSEDSANPYQSIVDRNVFSLKPPTPAADPSEANKPQVVKITLTGITTILGNKRVLMKTPPPAGKPGEPPKSEISYILTEGQREGDIEVIEIDDKAGSVKVNNGGTVQTLTFEKDGAKLPATAPPAAAPGVPGAPPGVPVAPGVKPLPQIPNAATPNFQLPTRVPRLPTPGNQAAASGINPAFGSGNTPFAQGTPAYGTPGFTPGGVGLAFQNTPGVPQAQIPAPAQTPPMSPEQAAIEIEANRMAGGPGAALLPPTPLTQHLTPPGATPQSPTIPQQQLPPIPGRPIGPGQY